MAVELRRARPLPGVAVTLVLLALCAAGGGTVMAAHLHDYNNSTSFRQNLALSEWGLGSEHGRRLLQTSKYLTYKSLDRDKAAGGASKPGNSYNRGCNPSYYCRS